MKNFTNAVSFDKYYTGVADISIQLLPQRRDSDANLCHPRQIGPACYGYTKNAADLHTLRAPRLEITPINVRFTRLFLSQQFAKADGTRPRSRLFVPQAIPLRPLQQAICDGSVHGAPLFRQRTDPRRK
jgi:hypothetical protein